MAAVAALVGVLGAAAAIGYFVSTAFAAPGVPAPTITSSPANPSTSTSATFTYTDTQSGVSFKCSLDSTSFTTCVNSGISLHITLRSQPHLQGRGRDEHDHELCDFLHMVGRAPHADHYIRAGEPDDCHLGELQVLRHPLGCHLPVLARLQLLQLVLL